MEQALPDQTGRAAPAAALSSGQEAPRRSLRERFSGVEFVPDLGADIGSGKWFRGLGSMIALSAVALAFWPDFAPLEAAPAMRLDRDARDEFRSQMIMPLALGSDSGRRMGATPIVRSLAAAPERPQLDMLATLAQGDSFDRMLMRAGVASPDRARVLDLIADVMPPGEIEPGTQVDIVLGRRLAEGSPRPLESLAFRARFDLALEVGRLEGDGALSLTRKPIRVDETPLRIRGTVGASLYRSARAAGAPASAVQAYLKALGAQTELGDDLRAGDTFDMIVAHRRAATGERQAGQLLYAGLERGDKPAAQLMRWGRDGRFYEASGVGEQRSGLIAPVPGRMSSSFGMRRHPILGYRRMHSGVDFKASHGTPIVAVTDGQVLSAGRAGGCGNAVKLRHGGGIDTRYCHMSRIAVGRGQSVRRGQVIGYVGSTGLSTGAHLHYEMYRSGRAVNPTSVSFVTRAQLEGEELKRFRETLARLKEVEAGAALADLDKTPQETAAEEPLREIDKLDRRRAI
ncbi:M23 family metallopeptidase [Qipengyuania sp. MTN3-11]|uniref:M23 family metallopeptidase n=1 Tax=Qipengyuania sp. MTN3-11 TaxID=3056557 RepID=UPI0036F3F06C